MIAIVAALCVGYWRPIQDPATVAQSGAKKTDQKDVLPTYFGPKKRVAVIDFVSAVTAITVSAVKPSGNWGTTALDITAPMDWSTGMEDILNTELIESKRFVILERKNLDKVTEEIARVVDPTAAAQTGKLLGAQFLFRGSLTELSYKKTKTSVGGGYLAESVGLEDVTFTAIAGIDLKLIEVETGRIIESVHAEGRTSTRAKTFDLDLKHFQLGSEQYQTSPLTKAIRAAINEGVKKVCQRADEMPWEGRVASVDATKSPALLYLNFGKDSGIKPGTELEIFRPGKAVIDPQTKVIIGREDDQPVGTCVIRNLEKTMTVATLKSGDGVLPQDGVRIPKPAPSGPR